MNAFNARTFSCTNFPPFVPHVAVNTRKPFFPEKRRGREGKLVTVERNQFKSTIKRGVGGEFNVISATRNRNNQFSLWARVRGKLFTVGVEGWRFVFISAAPKQSVYIFNEFSCNSIALSAHAFDFRWGDWAVAQLDKPRRKVSIFFVYGSARIVQRMLNSFPYTREIEWKSFTCRKLLW